VWSAPFTAIEAELIVAGRAASSSLGRVHELEAIARTRRAVGL
jgi:hypothetical protein